MAVAGSISSPGTRTFTITIVAATLPPVYHGGYTNATGTIGKPLSIPMPAGAFTSPGGQALTYTAKVLIPQHQLTTLNGDMIAAQTQLSDTVTPMMLPPGGTITVPAQWVAISQVGLSIGANGTISGTPTTLNYLIDEVTDTYQHDLSYQLEVIATNAYGSATAQFTLVNSAAGTSSLTASTSSAGTASPADAHGVGHGDPGADPALPTNAHGAGASGSDADPALPANTQGAGAGGVGADPVLPANAQGAGAGQGHPIGGTDTGGEVTPNLLPLPDPDDPPPSGGGGTSTPPVPNVQSYWFTYDADNRVDIVNGQLSNGQIKLKASTASYELSYDAAGNTRTRTTVSASSGDTLAQSSYYDERNELVRADYTVDLTTGGVSRGIEELRGYDAAGRLSYTAQFYVNGTTVGGSNLPYYKRDPDLDDGGYAPGTDVSGMLATATVEHYDASGQLLQEQNFGHAAGWDGTGASKVVPGSAPALDAPSWGGMALQNEVTYKTAVGAAGTGYDAVGNVVGYQYYDLAAARTDTYTVSYLKKDGYLERATAGSSSNGNYVPATDTSYYDNLGERIAIDQHVQLSSGSLADTVRAFAFDGNGQILQRRDGTVSAGVFTAQGGAGTDHYAYVAGQQVGSVDEAGGIDALDGLTAFSNTEAGSTVYVVQFGDTLKSIAQAAYGNASLWYVVAQANALGGDGDLVVGQSLTLPEVTTNANTADTFRPYDPAKIAGSTTPPSVYAPPPPPTKQHCQALSRVIAIAVTIIVSVYSGNPAAGAAAGNLAGQYSTMMFNGQFDWNRAARFALNPFSGNASDFARSIYDPPGNGAPGKADYKSAAIAAAAAYAGSYAGGFAGPVGSTANMVASAGAQYVTSVELGKVAGYGSSFSLRELGTTLGTAYAGAEISQAVGAGSVTYRDITTDATIRGEQPFSWQLLAKQATADVLIQGANYALRKTAGLPAHWDWREVGADVFGNALGNAAVAGFNAYQANQMPAIDTSIDPIDVEPLALNVADIPQTIAPAGPVQASSDTEQPLPPPPSDKAQDLPMISAYNGPSPNQPYQPFPLPAFVADELAKLPAGIFNALLTQGPTQDTIGTKFDIVENSVGEFRDFGNTSPRGQEGYSMNGVPVTNNQLPDIFDTNTNTVVVASNPSLSTGSVDPVLHETGHAYDADVGGSISEEFRAAYASDASTFDASKFSDYYFTKIGNPSGFLSEAYAESFANFFSGSPQSKIYATMHPALWAYWQLHQK